MCLPQVVPGMVSTIIPVHNRPQMLREAVESVLSQTYRPIEVIISDDGSTDETPQVADSLASAHAENIRVVPSKSNQGPGPTREAGRLLAEGEFIQYLDSDDLLCPGKFEIQVKALRNHPECGIAYGRTRHITMDGTVLADPFKWTGREYPTLFPWLLVDRWWCTHTPLYRRSLCDAIGPWSDLRWSQDWEYDGRVGSLGTRLAYCPELVSEHRLHSGIRQIDQADWTTPERAKERKRLLGMLFTHAKRAGVTYATPEMQYFSRWLFMTARQCGVAGLRTDAAECFSWARHAAGPARGNGVDFRLYRLLATTLGWTTTGRLFCHLDTLRNRRSPGSTTKHQGITT